MLDILYPKQHICIVSTNLQRKQALGDDMNDLNKDVVIGLMFIIGIWSFISGQFVISTMLFAGAAIYSNIVMRAKPKN